MSINSVLTAIQTAFNNSLTQAKTIVETAGPFTPQAIVQNSFSSPALFFGASGAAQARHEDERMLNQFGPVLGCRFTAIAVAKHAKSQRAASREALLIAEEIYALLYRNCFDLEFASATYKITLEPVATGHDKKLGHLSFWRVSWWHGIATNAEQRELEWQTIGELEGYDAEHFETSAAQDIDAPIMQTLENYP